MNKALIIHSKVEKIWSWSNGFDKHIFTKKTSGYPYCRSYTAMGLTNEFKISMNKYPFGAQYHSSHFLQPILTNQTKLLLSKAKIFKPVEHIVFDL